MRPIRGLDRPPAQWALVGACLVVTVLAGAEAVMLRRAKTANEALHAASLEDRLERQRLDITLGRERTAREALSARPSAPVAVTPATLTLDPVRQRAATPPPPTIDAPAPDRVVELRLRLSAAPDPRLVSYRIALRQWTTGLTLWSRGGLSPRVVDGHPVVVAALASDVLAPGAYEVALSATGPDGAVVDVASYDAGVRAAVR